MPCTLFRYTNMRVLGKPPEPRAGKSLMNGGTSNPPRTVLKVLCAHRSFYNKAGGLTRQDADCCVSAARRLVSAAPKSAQSTSANDSSRALGSAAAASADAEALATAMQQHNAHTTAERALIQHVVARYAPCFFFASFCSGASRSAPNSKLLTKIKTRSQ